MTDRTELEALLKLPEHQIVEVEFKRPDTKLLFKCGFPLTMNQEHDEGGIVIGEYYSGQDFAIARGVDIGSENSKFYVGRIIGIKTISPLSTKKPVGWLVAKLDESQHQEYMNQENRIVELHTKLNGIWDGKDGTTKLDILFDEYLAVEQAEAAIIDETLE